MEGLGKMFSVLDPRSPATPELYTNAVDVERDLTAVEDFSMFYLHHTGTMNGVLFLRATKVFFPLN